MAFGVDFYSFLLERLPPLIVKSPLRQGPINKLDTLAKALATPWPRDGLVMEMGVYKGRSLELMADTLPEHSIYGFDSFTGFPEDGRKDWPMDLDRGGQTPEIRDNAQLIIGFFEDTMDKFLAEHPGPVGFIHIDCDIYSSTRTILNNLKGRIIPDTVIAFDELLNYRGFENNEILSFYEFLLEQDLNFEWIASTGRVMDLTSYVTAFNQMPWKGKNWLAEGFEHEFAVRITKDGPPLRTTNETIRSVAASLLKARPLDQPLSPSLQ